MSLIQASQALGFTVGPAIQAALTPIGCSAEAKSGGTFLSLDTYTTCGWLTALLGEMTKLNPLCNNNIANVKIIISQPIFIVFKNRDILKVRIKTLVNLAILHFAGLLCLVMMLPTIFIEHNVSGRGEGGASDSTSSQDEGSRYGYLLIFSIYQKTTAHCLKVYKCVCDHTLGAVALAPRERDWTTLPWLAFS